MTCRLMRPSAMDHGGSDLSTSIVSRLVVTAPGTKSKWAKRFAVASFQFFHPMFPICGPNEVPRKVERQYGNAWFHQAQHKLPPLIEEIPQPDLESRALRVPPLRQAGAMARTWEDKENARRTLKNRSSNVSIYGWESFPRKGNPRLRISHFEILKPQPPVTTSAEVPGSQLLSLTPLQFNDAMTNLFFGA